MGEMRKLRTSPTLEAVHEECVRTGRAFGNRLTEIVERYRALLERYSPRVDFGESEWQRLCAVLKERWPQPDTAATPEHLSEVLSQAGEYDLAQRVERLELVETTALLEDAWRDLSKQAEGESSECDS